MSIILLIYVICPHQSNKCGDLAAGGLVIKRYFCYLITKQILLEHSKVYHLCPKVSIPLSFIGMGAGGTDTQHKHGHPNL